VITNTGPAGTGIAAVLLQWLHRAGWTAGQRLVGCAHPSRVAALTAAAAAADDCGSAVGAAVGYSIPFEEVAQPVHFQIEMSLFSPSYDVH
jgi:ATP-dependent RNA helicase DDX35